MKNHPDMVSSISTAFVALFVSVLTIVIKKLYILPTILLICILILMLMVEDKFFMKWKYYSKAVLLLFYSTVLSFIFLFRLDVVLFAHKEFGLMVINIYLTLIGGSVMLLYADILPKSGKSKLRPVAYILLLLFTLFPAFNIFTKGWENYILMQPANNTVFVLLLPFYIILCFYLVAKICRFALCVAAVTVQEFFPYMKGRRTASSKVIEYAIKLALAIVILLMALVSGEVSYSFFSDIISM